MGMITEEEKLETKKKILEVSRKSFIENGFEKTNIRKIAKEVGIGSSTVYGYFSSKIDLFIDSFINDMEDMNVVDYKIESVMKDDINVCKLSELLVSLYMTYINKIYKLDKHIIKQLYLVITSKPEFGNIKYNIRPSEKIEQKIIEIFEMCHAKGVFLCEFDFSKMAKLILNIWTQNNRNYISIDDMKLEDSIENIKNDIEMTLLGKIKM